MYADKITYAKTIDESPYRRTKQINFNTENNQSLKHQQKK
jgi:excinuclease ABC subunit B